jgi:mRNA interferase RelE/StbE
MPYELHIERHAEKDLNKLEKSLFIQIATRIKELAGNPHPQGSKKITGSQNDWRLRVGDYRILYNESLHRTSRCLRHLFADEFSRYT